MARPAEFTNDRIRARIEEMAAAGDEIRPNAPLGETAGDPRDGAAEPPAAVLRRLPSSGLEALGEKARDYARAENTRRAYDSDWRQFSSWLRRQGFSPRPPAPRTVGLYLTACVDGGRGKEPVSVATLERRLSGICWHYRQSGEPLDTQDRHIATVLAGIRRAHGRPPAQKEAIFADDLLAMLGVLENDLRGLRDRAILAIGFAGRLRRSEIVGLDCGPDQSGDGSGWIEIFGAARPERGATDRRALSRRLRRGRPWDAGGERRHLGAPFERNLLALSSAG